MVKTILVQIQILLYKYIYFRLFYYYLIYWYFNIRWHKYVVILFKIINFNIITSMVKQMLRHLVSIYFHVFGPKVRCMCRTSHSIYK